MIPQNGITPLTKIYLINALYLKVSQTVQLYDKIQRVLPNQSRCCTANNWRLFKKNSKNVGKTSCAKKFLAFSTKKIHLKYVSNLKILQKFQNF